MSAPEAWGSFQVSAVARKGLAPLLEGLYGRTRKPENAGQAGEDGEEELWWAPGG